MTVIFIQQKLKEYRRNLLNENNINISCQKFLLGKDNQSIVTFLKSLPESIIIFHYVRDIQNMVDVKIKLLEVRFHHI